ncbi:MAG: SDR family oxidoreductase [Myxococcales bacterium]|nr:SDR family oxidoreductase [Myxococcales bacterium]
MAPARDLADRHYVITGANTGIGKETARALAARGARVTMACRTEAKTRPVIDELTRTTANDGLSFVALDLADLASVRTCAAELIARGGPIHGLINNAGLAGPRGLTKDGFELTFGTNHLGPFLLTKQLLPLLEATPGARIVNVASASHYQAKRIDWDALRKPTASVTAMGEYAVSKLANVLFTKELARRLPPAQVAAYALHPGVIASDIWSRRIPRPVAWLMTRFMKSTADGARTSIYCATAPELAGVSGRYYTDSKEKRPSRLADDAALAAELWQRSEAWVAA